MKVLAGEHSDSYTLDRRAVLLHQGWLSSSTEHAALVGGERGWGGGAGGAHGAMREEGDTGLAS